MKKPRVKILVFIILLSFLITWYGLLTVSVVKAGGIEGTDFHWLYAVGQVWMQFGPQHVYDLDLAIIAQAKIAGIEVGEKTLLLPNHPPFVYPWMAILAGLPFRVAYVVNFASTWIFTTLFFIIIYRLLKKRKWPTFEAVMLVIGLFLFEPFIISLIKGQDTYILLIGGLLLLYGVLEGKDWLGGIGLGLILIRPQVALVLAIPFIFNRRKIFWWFLASAAFLSSYSFLLVGWEGTQQFFQVLLLSTGVQEHGWDEILMYDLVGLMIRVFPAMNLDIIHYVGWIVFGTSIMGLCLVWNKSRSIQAWHISLAISLSIFSSPHFHYHDLGLLLVTLLGLVLTGMASGRLNFFTASLLPFLVSIALIASELWSPLNYSFAYMLMLSLPLINWVIGRRDTNPSLT